MLYKNIAVALSGKENGIPILDEAVRIAKEQKANLFVIHVNDPHAGEISMMMDNKKMFIEDDFVTMFKNAGHKEIGDQIVVKTVKNASICKGVAELSAGCDLLILGHDKKSKVKELLTSSIDEFILNESNCPVLIVPK